MKGNLIALLALLCMGVRAQEGETNKIRIIGDRVSLRTRPELQSELLERVMRGEEFVCVARSNGWVAVQAPDSLSFWVSTNYVRDGVVVVPKLNVRSGPSVNYNVVCVLDQGVAVASRGEFNDWLKIAPPSGCIVWISGDYVEPVRPPGPEPSAIPAPEPVTVSVTTNAPPPVATSIPDTQAEKELQPIVLALDHSKPQGVVDEFPGILRRANPGLYKLVMVSGKMAEPVCLVRGNEAQLEQLLNRSLMIKGSVYWVVGVDIPVIKPSKIVLDPIVVP